MKYPDLSPKEIKPKLPAWLPQPEPLPTKTTRDDKSPPPGKDGI